jgi:hypothetical protein
MKRYVLGFVLAVSLGFSAHASVVNIPPVSGEFRFFGNIFGVSFGQNFTAPDAVLLDYTVYVRNDITDGTFRSQLFQSNGVGPIGSSLFTSALTPIPLSYEPITFSPNITLIPGAEYIAIVTAFGISSVVSASSGYVLQGAALAGSPVSRAVGDPSVTANWACVNSCDLSAAFHANFSPVVTPLPPAFALMLPGLAGLYFAARRKRKGPGLVS